MTRNVNHLLRVLALDSLPDWLKVKKRDARAVIRHGAGLNIAAGREEPRPGAFSTQPAT
jgi:hypothetical protein